MRTTIRSSSWRYSSSSRTTRNSAVVVCSDPSTRPTRSSAHEAIRSCTRFAERAVHEAAVAHAVAELPLERARSAPGSAARGDRDGARTRRAAARPPSGRARRDHVAVGSCPLASHRTIPDHAWPPGTCASRTYQEYRRYSEMREQRRPLSRAERGDHDAALRRQVRHAMALDRSHRWHGRQLVQRPVGDDEASRREGGGDVSLGGPHLRVQRPDQPRRIRVAAWWPWRRAARAQRRGRSRLVHPRAPPIDPTCSSAIHDRRDPRSQTAAPTANVPQIPGTGPDGSSSVSRASDPADAVDERDPRDAVVDAVARSPVLGLDRRVDRALRRRQRLVRIQGAPYSGDQPSTKIRAMRRILPTATDASAQAGLTVSDEVVHVPPPAYVRTLVRMALGQQCGSPCANTASVTTRPTGSVDGTMRGVADVPIEHSGHPSRCRSRRRSRTLRNRPSPRTPARHPMRRR